MNIAQKELYLTHVCGLVFLKQLQKDLEEVKELLTKATRKRVRDVLMTEKHKLELEMKNQPPLKLKDVAEEEKLSLGGYTVKINNYGRITFLSAYQNLGISEERAGWPWCELQLPFSIME